MCVKIEGKSFSCWGETKRRPMFLVFPSRWRRFNFHTIIGAISIDYKEVSTCWYWTEWFGFNTPSLLCSRIIHCTICMGFNLQPKTKCWKLSKIVQNVIISDYSIGYSIITKMKTLIIVWRWNVVTSTPPPTKGEWILYPLMLICSWKVRWLKKNVEKPYTRSTWMLHVRGGKEWCEVYK
jgi:hypothetical protein